MEDHLKISIVTPSFNQASFLEETIQSVVGQDYPNLEYVVIDGGSEDGSLNTLERYGSRFHYWCSEKDRGHGDALNKGFSHTSGEIMAWLNSDDKYLPWAFHTVNRIFHDFPHVNWIVGFNAWWNDEGVLTNASRVPKNIYDFLLGNYGWIQQESVFWRRSLWERTGGFISEDLKLMVDGELWSRFFLQDELYAVDCILAGYRYHSGNRAKHQYQNCISEMDHVIRSMATRCSEHVNDTYRRLKPISKLAKLPLIRHLPVNQLARKLLPAAFAAAHYKIIQYEQGRWVEGTSPFSC